MSQPALLTTIASAMYTVVHRPNSFTANDTQLIQRLNRDLSLITQRLQQFSVGCSGYIVQLTIRASNLWWDLKDLEKRAELDTMAGDYGEVLQVMRGYVNRLKRDMEAVRWRDVGLAIVDGKEESEILGEAVDQPVENGTDK